MKTIYINVCLCGKIEWVSEYFIRFRSDLAFEKTNEPLSQADLVDNSITYMQQSCSQ